MIEILLSLTAALCWALNGIAYRKGVAEVSVFTANFHRTLFATIFFLPFAVLAYPVEIDTNTAIVLVFSAILSFYIGDLSYFASLKRLPVSVALPAASTYPIYVVILSTVVYGAEIQINALISAFLVFLAVYVIYGGDEKNFTSSGLFFALLAAFSWALAILTLDFLTDRLPVPVVAFTRMLLCLALLSFTVKGEEIARRDSILYAGFFGGFLSFAGVMVFLTAIKISSSWNVVQPSATSPVFSAILGSYLLGEKIDLRLAAGIGIIVVAVLLLLLQ